MKYILQTTSPCVECKHPKARKEYRLEREDNDQSKVTNYSVYIINDCKKCGRYRGELK